MRPVRRNQERSRYATGVDFGQIFVTEMDSLYQLAFVLTADPEKAERVFVAGLEGALKSNYVFKRWAHSWAKRIVIQNAIHLIQPRPTESGLSAALMFSDSEKQDSKNHFDLKSVLSLAPFERFVFVMTVLEHHSDHECAVLLSCLALEVRHARAKALEQLASSAHTEQSSDAARDEEVAR